MGARTVTVGLPVRNGEALLDSAIDALVRQTHHDLRILLSDNCSTDATPLICRAWVGRDPRIEYVRQARPLSALQHFRWVFERCSTRYFMWAAHDDLRSENYVEALVKALDAHPKASIAFGDLVNFSDLRTLAAQPVVPYGFANEGLSYRERAANVLLWGCAELYGMIRAEHLQGYGWYDVDYASDAAISTHLAVRGDFVHVSDAVFYQWVAPELMTPSERARKDSFRSVKPIRWLRLAWTCAGAAVRAAPAADVGRNRVAMFIYLYLRVRPVKLRAELFAAVPPIGQRVLRWLNSTAHLRRGQAAGQAHEDARNDHGRDRSSV